MWGKAVVVQFQARRIFVLGTVLASLLLVALPRAHAVDPERHISQYGHTAWRVQDGFFDGAPWSIAQTADGYLWIGGANGLLRFDGVRFVPWTPPPGKQLLSPAVARVLAARDGGLWIGTMRGLSRWTNQDLINYSRPIAFCCGNSCEPIARPGTSDRPIAFLGRPRARPGTSDRPNSFWPGVV